MEAFIARQPIFDRQRQLYGYELLYRSGSESNQFDGTEASSATNQVISSALLSAGFEDVIRGRKAFLNFDERLLRNGMYLSLPRQSTVIEILETVRPTPSLVALCQEIHEQGYMLALDDFVSSPGFDPMMPLVQFIKVDIRVTSRREQERLLALYRSRGIAMLAEKVETYEEFGWARTAGYDYFQGYFFARPSVMRIREVPALKLNCLRLLTEMQKPDLDFAHLEELVRTDVALTFKLLRYANSALFGRRGEIRSIKRAFSIVGVENIRRWVTLATLPMLASDKPSELARLSIVRARFCERLIELSGIGRTNEAFLMGMFSLLDALLDQPLDDALRSISLTPEITQALLGTAPEENALHRIYQLTRCYEQGDWDEVERLAKACRLKASAVGEAYLSAARWAETMLRAVGD